MTKDTYEQINKMLDMVSDATWYIQNLSEKEYERSADSLVEDLQSVIEAVNLKLLDSPRVCFCRLHDFDKGNGKPGYRKELVR